MRFDYLGGVVLAALIGLQLTWAERSKPAVHSEHAVRAASATPTERAPEPANCAAECLKGYRWGVAHEVTENHDCRTLSPNGLDGCLRVVQEVERFNAVEAALRN
jgi:hypothetical protein